MANMEKYYGNYLGIVVNSNDPENRNRIQVWIPNLSNTLYLNWNNDLSDKTIDYNFTNINADFVRLKNSLPWAECASPLIGGGTAMNINPNVDSGVSASSVTQPLQQVETQNNNDGVVPIENVLPDFENDSNVDFNQTPEELDFMNNSSNPDSGDLPTDEGKGLDGDSLFPENTTAVPTGIGPEGNATGTTQVNAQIKKSDGIITQKHNGIRNRDLSNNLKLAIQNGLAGSGLNWNSTSGGQPTQQEGGARVGSTRHDNGDATDGQFIDANTGRILDPVKNVEDKTRIQNALSGLVGSGIKGVGWGTNYMGNSTFHLDIKGDNNGGTLVWGANGSSSNASEWVTASVNSVTPSQQLAISGSSKPVLEDPLHSVSTTANGNPSPYGAAKGVISCPSVGARVWVFFYGGDLQKPVYFAMSITDAEYKNAGQV